MLGATAASSTPLILAICPSSPGELADPSREALLRDIEQRIVSELDGRPGLSLIGQEDFAPYSVGVTHDPQRESLGHIPYSDEYFTALATVLARRIHALVGPAFKVIVLDCDNTLWKGVVGEEAPGVVLSPAFRRFRNSGGSGQGFPDLSVQQERGARRPGRVRGPPRRCT